MRSSHIIIQCLLPYIISCFHDDNTLVRVEAAEDGIELISALKFPIEFIPSDFKIFQRYIFPEYRKLGAQMEQYVLVTFMKLVGKISDYTRKFIEEGIKCETAYMLKLASSQDSESKEKRRTSQDNIFLDSEQRLNLESELDEIANSIFYQSLDITANISYVYQCALAAQLPEY